MIHHHNPFSDDPGSRDPVRRFRGRLAAGVTVVTAGTDETRTGLTVSSLLALEGEPGWVEAVVGPTSDLWDLVEETGRFVVHVCSTRHRALAEVFAGTRPNPGGPFAGSAVSPSDWGPILDDVTERAYCTLESRRELGYTGLITGRIDRVEIGDLTDPLLHFRGDYHSLQ